jgi:hypothetical protein
MLFTASFPLELMHAASNTLFHIQCKSWPRNFTNAESMADIFLAEDVEMCANGASVQIISFWVANDH